MKKRLLALLLCVCVILGSFVSLKPQRVQATSVAVGGLVYVTGEAIFSFVVTGMIVAGILHGNPSDIGSIDVTEYYDQLAVEYEKVVNALIEDGTLRYYECTNALKKLWEYDDVMTGCNALADYINECRDKGIDLDGNVLDYGQLSKNIDKSFIVQDTNGSLIVSPSVFNDLVGNIDSAVGDYVVNNNIVTTDCGLVFDYTIPIKRPDRFYETDDGIVDGLYTDWNNFVSRLPVYENRAYILFTDNIAYYIIYTDGYEMSISDGYICALDYEYEYPNGTVGTISVKLEDMSLTYNTRSHYKYDTKKLKLQYVINEGSVIAYRGLDKSTVDTLGIPAERDIFGDISDIQVGLSAILDTPLVDVYDYPVVVSDDDVDVPNVAVDELVIVPPVNDVLEHVSDIPIPQDTSIPVETAPDVILPWVDDLTTDTLPDISEGTQDIVLDTDTDLPVVDEQPTVDTGWDWLNDILNAILSVLYDIWSAVVGIVDAIISGIRSIIEWLLVGLKDMLVALFMPSDGFLDEHVDSFLEHFSFFKAVYTSIDEFKYFIQDAEDIEPPTIVVDLSQARGNVNYGDSVTITFDWFKEFKPTTDKFLSAFFWVVFIWNTFRKLPNIINGVGAVSNVVSDVKGGGD